MITLRNPLVTFAAAVVTNSVVASCVVFVPAVAVGAAGVPVKVGEADIANVVPVPVCEAILVAAPTEVIGPVKLTAGPVGPVGPVAP
jgi:hypothetical protein